MVNLKKNLIVQNMIYIEYFMRVWMEINLWLQLQVFSFDISVFHHSDFIFDSSKGGGGSPFERFFSLINILFIMGYIRIQYGQYVLHNIRLILVHNITVYVKILWMKYFLRWGFLQSRDLASQNRTWKVFFWFNLRKLVGAQSVVFQI